MNRLFCRLILSMLTVFLCACSTMQPKQGDEEFSYLSKSLSASGSGAMPADGSLTRAQSRLAAEQVAKMNAYRALASALYREGLADGSTVGGQVVRDEAYRIYVDTFLREAKVDAMQAYGNTMQARLTLHVTDRFYRCMSGRVDVVRQCLQQDNKLPYTRLGYASAERKTVSFGCVTADCNGMLHVAGFSGGKNAFDRGLLSAGLYDSEWAVNTAGRLLVNFILLNSIPEL